MEHLATRTWPEIRAYLESRDGLIVPVGTCEQHGPHLPLNTDTLLSEYFCGRLSTATGLLIAPTLAYGVNLPCDRGLAGTTTLSPEILRRQVRELTEWWSCQGFRKFYVITAHGDPFHVQALEEASGGGILFHQLFDDEYPEILDGQRWMKHACEGETSVMLHLFPDLVRKEAIADHETPFDDFLPYLYHEKTDPIEGSSGVQGYPTLASAEKGARIVEQAWRALWQWYDEGPPPAGGD